MKLQYLLQQVFYEPSLITADAHASIRQLLEGRLGEPGAPFQTRAPGEGPCGEKVDVEQMEILDGVAHIPIGGAIGQKLAPFQRGEGAVDVLDLIDELDIAEDSDEVRLALLDIDSPGGMFLGTPELAARITAFSKPIYAFSNGMIASAAYWIASATDGIFTTPSASIGSIGVYIPIMDATGWYAMRGVKWELIKAGKLKGMGFPGIPLSDAQREHLQQRVNQMYQMFAQHVRAMRGPELADDTMQGQTFLADEAMDRGLIDGTVKDKWEVLETLDLRF